MTQKEQIYFTLRSKNVVLDIIRQYFIRKCVGVPSLIISTNNDMR